MPDKADDVASKSPKKVVAASLEDAYDLVVIGSGPAGIHAAVQAAKLKQRVCILERTAGKIGGAWIHTGTLPSKAMRESLAAIHSIKSHVGEQWVERVTYELHSGKLFAHANKVSAAEEKVIRGHLQNNGIKIIEGSGSLEDRHSVRVIPTEGPAFVLPARHILIATGSRPRRPDDIPFDGWRVVDSDDILALTQIPKSMLIYGAGVVGCEYACIFSALGVQVTVVDSRSRILQFLDFEVGTELQRSMEALGVTFVLGAPLKAVHVKSTAVEIVCGTTSLQADVLFFAAGRVSNTDHMGLERLGIGLNDRGAIEVNENFQTKVSNIYAAGDVIGPPALAATSSQQGRFVSCHAFGVKTAAFPLLFPVGVYTIPELSMVGRTEEELKAAGVDYVVGRSNYSEIARGSIRGDHHGLLKLIICRTSQKILGIHIVGADACNLIHIGLAFMSDGRYAQDLINMIFNYPTLAEAYRVAAFNGLNKIFTDGMIQPPTHTSGEPLSPLARSS